LNAEKEVSRTIENSRNISKEKESFKSKNFEDLGRETCSVYGAYLCSFEPLHLA
jgi:hypothetical protein